MNKSYICNYATIRFLPYTETQEFVNIGIVLACSEINYFNYRIELHRRDRISGFFPELDQKIFMEGRKYIKDDLSRIRRELHVANKNGQYFMKFKLEDFNKYFKELVRPRESIFRFGPISTTTTSAPDEELDRIYGDLVERQFAKHEEYQENIMRARLKDFFKQNLICDFKEGKVGNESYHVKFPFVREDSFGFRAIKPLDLAKREPTKIIEHGDAWIAKIKRLKELEYNPELFLFTVNRPARSKLGLVKASDKILCELDDLHVIINDFDDMNSTIQFATSKK